MSTRAARGPGGGPRAARVLIKIEDSTIGKGMDGGGDAEQEEAGEQVEEQQTEQTNVEASVDVVVPASRRARLPPGSYADRVVERDTDDDYDDEDEEDEDEEEDDDDDDEEDEEDKEEEEVEEEQEGEKEEEGNNIDGAAASGDVDDRRSSRVAGVCWNRNKKRWEARYTVDGKRVYLGYHATAEAAALAVHQYVKDGVKPKELRVRTSQFKGVSKNTRNETWRAQCQGKNLGAHATNGGGCGAGSPQVRRGRRRSCEAPQLSVQGCQLGQAPREVAGEVQAQTPWIPRHGGGCGAGVQQGS